MKKFLNIFFVTLGVIFFCIIILAVYFYVADPWGIKPLLFGDGEVITNQSGTDGTTTTDQNSLLSPEQESRLEEAGIDPAQLPNEITAEQEACFEAELGEARVAEIKGGAMPTMTEFFQVRGCI